MVEIAGEKHSVGSLIEVVKNVGREIKDDHIVLSAAGVAFFGFVALIPALAAFLSVYGLVADPQTATEELERFLSSLPSEASDLLVSQLSSLADNSTRSLSVTLAVSIVLSIWAASAGMSHLIEAVNMVYDQPQERSFIARRALGLALTLGAIVGAGVAIFVIAALPRIMRSLLPSALGWVVTGLIWLAVAFVFVLALSILYRIAPERRDPAWHWVTPGAIVGVVLWALAATGFSFYVRNFGSYNETYGSLAAVVVLLLWIFMSAFVILLAGEINSTLEQRRDS